LGRAVASLDDNHRLVFVMHDMEGFTHQEIAAAMDTPVGTAKARLSRARSKLKEILTLGMNSPGPSLEMDS
jgi:RNA polymerase sigma-70 factor, ECF subfamily